MNLYQYIQEVRTVLRDSSYPEGDIISALNRVIKFINSLGRFTFHENSYSLTLTANTSSYAIPSTVIDVKTMIYAAGNNQSEKEIPRRRELWDGSPKLPTTQGDAPSEWTSYAGNWYIFPVPSTTMALQAITVLHDKDLAELISLTDVCGLPDRYSNVLVYGASSELKPSLIVGGDNGKKIESLYYSALNVMKEQDLWKFNYLPMMRQGLRWQNLSEWGRRKG